MDLDRPLAIITPTLDGDVLAVVAGRDGAFTTGQIHRLLTQHSEEGIRKVLRRLTDQGIVRSERVGNAFSYQLNQEHLATPHIIAIAETKKTFLERLEELLKSWQPRPVYAAVFGSSARGQMRPSSDIDLLLVRPQEIVDAHWEDQVDHLAVTVTRWLGNDTRVIEFTEGEIVARRRGDRLLHDVLAQGLTVAGTRSWFVTQMRGH